MSKPIRISILANGSQARREVMGVGSMLKKTLGAAAALGVGVGVVQTFKDVVTSASDAQQSLGATESVFKKYSDTVVSRSNKAAEALGLSANEYRELANVSGAMLKSSGMPLRKVADLTDKLTHRAADMAATFGGTTKDAVEAVSSLLRGEADPIERYGVSIKQSDVNARLAAKGLDKLTGKARKQAEQTERLNALFEQTSDSAGQFARESNTLAGQQQRLSAKIDNLKAKVGTALLPVLTKGAEVASDKLVPALEDTADWVGKNKDEFTTAGNALKSTLLPPLKVAGEVAKATAEFVGDLPGPVKQVGIEAGIAALALPRLTSAATAAGGAFTTASAKVRQFHAEMTYAETRSAAVKGALGKLGGAAKAAAGVGGMVALTEGAKRSDSAMGALLTTLGGAATGFALGGPIGALIGGVGGAGLVALESQMGKNKEVTKGLIQNVDGLRDSLNPLTGAVTADTREWVKNSLVKAGAWKEALSLGINANDLVTASLKGQGPAYEKVTSTIRDSSSALQERITALDLLITAEEAAAASEGKSSTQREKDLRKQKDALVEQKKTLDNVSESVTGLKAKRLEEREALLLEANAMRDYTALAGKVPQNVITKLKADGFVPTIKNLSKVLAGTKPLTNKQLRLILKATDSDKTVAQLRKATKAAREVPKKTNTKLTVTGDGDVKKRANDTKKSLEGVGKAKPNLSSWKKGLTDSLTSGKNDATRGANQINKALGDGTKKAKANLGPFQSSLNSGINTSKTTAASGGSGVGSALGAGIYAGIGPWVAPIANRAAFAVSNAINAARREAKIKSPSRKMREVGDQMGAGLHQGLARSRVKSRTEGQKLARAVIAGAMDGTKGANKAWDTLTKAIKKNIKGKNEAAREKKLLKSLKDEHRQLLRNAKAQDKVTAKLKAASQAYKTYASTVRASIIESGNITTLGQNDDGSVSITNLVDQMKNRVNDAKRFAQLIRDLIKSGLNKTSIQQMLAAGPEAALATAEAITYGGETAINELNTLQADLAKTAGSLGNDMADKFSIAGKASAEGFIAGLVANQKKLDKAAKKIAKALTKAVRRQLGIKSPSRVFKGIGGDVVDGLRIGLDARDIKRQGSQLATSLQRGFGRPALDAYASTSSTAGQVSITVNVPPTANKAEIGREVASALDSYYKAGGRRAA